MFSGCSGGTIQVPIFEPAPAPARTGRLTQSLCRRTLRVEARSHDDAVARLAPGGIHRPVSSTRICTSPKSGPSASTSRM